MSTNRAQPAFVLQPLCSHLQHEEDTASEEVLLLHNVMHSAHAAVHCCAVAATYRHKGCLICIS